VREGREGRRVRERKEGWRVRQEGGTESERGKEWGKNKGAKITGANSLGANSARGLFQWEHVSLGANVARG
jgi:hypothetical protein